MKHMLGLILVLIIIACAGTISLAKSQYPTLLVVNHSGEFVRVYVDGLRVATVASSKECIILRSLSRSYNVISFSSVIREKVFAPEEQLYSFDGWQITLSRNWKFDVLSLQPAKRCEK